MYNYIHIQTMYTYYVFNVPINFVPVGYAKHMQEPGQKIGVDCEMISQKCLRK